MFKKISMVLFFAAVLGFTMTQINVSAAAQAGSTYSYPPAPGGVGAVVSPIKNPAGQVQGKDAAKKIAAGVSPVKQAVSYAGEKKFALKSTAGILPSRSITVKNGETTVLGLSQTEVNTIRLNSRIVGVTDSKVGDVSIAVPHGKDMVAHKLIVQFTPVVIIRGAKRELKYPVTPASVVISTNAGTFTLVFVPRTNIVARTYFITVSGNGFAGHRHNRRDAEVVKQGGFGRYVVSILRAVYNGKTPDGFRAKIIHKEYASNYPQVRITLEKIYKSEGLDIYEFHITNQSGKTASFSNKEFLSLVKNPEAISLSNEHIYNHAYTRLFIIAKRRGN